MKPLIQTFFDFHIPANCVSCGNSLSGKQILYCSTKCADYEEDRRARNVRREYINSFKKHCVLCGYHKCKAALSFHHKDPDNKLFTIGADGPKRGWDIIDAEIKKCLVLCMNCHTEIHWPDE